jgi:hypothetical protein
MTYLLIEDIEDAPNPPRDLEGEQGSYLRARLGEPLWASLSEREERNGKDRS